MQIVIDIPKEAYEIIKKDTESEMYIIQVIKQGIPLSENHGRLIDADVLADGFEDNYEFCEVVNATPTIIEADKEYNNE